MKRLFLARISCAMGNTQRMKMSSWETGRLVERGSCYKTYQNALKHFSDSGKSEMVDLYLEQMKMDDHTPDKYLYSYLISRAVEENDIKHSVSLLQQYNETHVDSDPHPYTPILKLLIQLGNITEAQNLWDMMEIRGIALDEIAYSYLITAHISENNYTKAFSLIEDMLLKGFEPCLRSYKTWLTKLVNEDAVRHFMELWEIMNRKKIQFDTELYNLFIKIHTHHKTVFMNRINRIIKEMKEKSVPFDIFTYQYLIRLYTQKKNINKVEILFKELQRDGIALTGVIFSDLMQSFAKNGFLEKAEKLIEDTDSSVFAKKFWIVGLTSLLHGYARSGNVEKVKHMMDYMSRHQMEPDEIALVGVFTGLLQADKVAEASDILYANNSKLNNENKAIVYNHFAKKYAQIGEIDTCIAVMNALEKIQVTVKPTVYIELILTHFRSNNAEEAKKLSKRILREQNITVKECIYAVDSLIPLNQHTIVREWIDYMCRKNYWPSKWYKENKDGHIISNNPQRNIGSK